MSALTAPLPVLPIAIPLVAGALLVLIGRKSSAMASGVSLVALGAVLVCALALAIGSDSGEVLPYRLGDWPAPFGILLAVDRLTGVMLVAVAVIGIACQLAASDAVATRGPWFAALLQFQVMGLNGAFLTADLFNLFVFFEVLLIASYALLLHGARREAVRASVQFVVVNLIGAALFLLAVSLLYGMLGTLNLADLALRIPAVPGPDRALVTSAVLLLLVVFGIKSALLPLGLWLPGTYASAPIPVAAMFAIMTKVGIYAIARLTTLLTGDPVVLPLLQQVLLWGGIATTLFGALLTISAPDLRTLACALIAASAGTLLTTLGVGGSSSLQAMPIYLLHTTFGTAALLLIAGAIADARGESAADRFDAIGASRPSVTLGAAFLFVAIAVAGLPPLSGFVAKLFVLDAVRTSAYWGWIWLAVLANGLAALIALARAGSAIFWKAALPSPRADSGLLPGTTAAALLLAACAVAIVGGAMPLSGFTSRAATQLIDPAGYIGPQGVAP